MLTTNLDTVKYDGLEVFPPVSIVIPEYDDDIYIMSDTSTRLDILADRYYGDVSLYKILMLCNDIPSIVPQVGTTIRIPSANRLPDILTLITETNLIINTINQ